jgi:hypothetical protein
MVDHRRKPAALLDAASDPSDYVFVHFVNNNASHGKQLLPAISIPFEDRQAVAAGTRPRQMPGTQPALPLSCEA